MPGEISFLDRIDAQYNQHNESAKKNAYQVWYSAFAIH